MIKVLFALAVISIGGAAQAGPFGVDMQSFNPVSAGCKQLPKAPDLYECPPSAIPGAISPFKFYEISWAPSSGVCHIAAFFPNPNGRVVSGNYAAEVQDIVSALMEKYGQPNDNIGAATNVEDWGASVKLSWNDPTPELNAIILNHYSIGYQLAHVKDRELPSLSNYEASLSIYYINGEFNACESAAWNVLNTPEARPTARSRDLESGL